MLRFNNQGVPAWEDRALIRLWPLARSVVTRRLGLKATTIRDDLPRVLEAWCSQRTAPLRTAVW